jgi:acetolactate synthase-1/2/3 large subunit
MTLLRPVFLLGNGLRGNPDLLECLCALKAPVLVTWQAIDMISEDSPVYCGRPGVLGQRAANIIQQKCNWLMIAGARLDNEQIGHNLDNFAPHAFKTVVDVDPAELEKYPKEWGRFLLDLNRPIDSRYGDHLLPFVSGGDDPTWLAECKNLYRKFRFELEGTDDGDFVNPYSFIRELSDLCQPDDILVPGSSGQQSCAFMQAFKVKKGQRVLLCNTIGAMGMEPMAIGAAISTGRRVIVVTGDGGFAQNFQELEIVKRLDLPIHYFIFDNCGYGSISAMQDNHFQLRIGSDSSSGLTLPSIEKIAKMWEFPYMEMQGNYGLGNLRCILDIPCATITRVKVPMEFRPTNKVASRLVDGVMVSDAMENVSPKLPADELAALME